jgi:glycerol kinase
MPGGCILAIDQGTTSSRAVVVDRTGEPIGTGQVAFPQYFPRPGWVEHDLDEIWRSVQEAIAAALKHAGIGPSGLRAIGVTNQRETVAAWDRETGEPLGRAIVWQDRRVASTCEELVRQGHEERVASLTGLTLDPYFSATKLSWLLRETPGALGRAERGELAAGTVDTWLLWKLTGGRHHLTDYTNASRTLLFDINRCRWDESLCSLFGVPPAVLPGVQPSASPFGATDGSVLGAEVDILGVAGDQQAALVGQAAFAPGQAKNTYGTGCFLLANAGARAARSRNRLLLSLGAQAGAAGPEYVLEGSVFVAGALVQWLRDELGIIARSEDVEALAALVPDTAGVAVVPAFTGLGAPYWDPRARGAILGLTRGAGKAHIARASLEAIALSTAELVGAMSADLGRPIPELRVDGGAARNDLLMQMQADFAGIPVIRPVHTETTAMGAAYLAGISAGTWSGFDEVTALWRAERTFEPASDASWRAARRAEWRRAVERARDWALE